MRRIALGLLIPLLLASCSAHTPATKASPSSSASLSPSPSAGPTKKPVHIASARWAVYTDRGSIWLYDVRANSVRKVTTGGVVRLPEFLDAGHISFIQGAADGSENTLRTLDLKSGSATDVFSEPTGIGAYDWSPDHQTIAYVTTDSDSYPHIRFRSVADGSSQPITTLARALGRGANASDEARVEFSKDGSQVLIVYTPADGSPDQPVPAEQSQFQVRARDGSLSFAGDMSKEPTMGAFSPDGKTVEFRDDTGVRTWTVSTGATRTLRKVTWFDPSPALDGRYVAFDTGWESPSVRVRIFDLRGVTVQTLSVAGRAFPVFAGPRTVWAQQVTKCSGACLTPGQPVARVYAIDVQNKSERLLAITSIQDVDVLYQ
ncbi:MAG: hypothetical protein ACXVES_08415 [Actinomycetota bacterium]